MVELNFDVAIGLRRVYLGLTGERDEQLLVRNTIVEIGIDN